MFRPSYLLAAVPLVFAAACGDKATQGIIGVGANATVRFVNATNGSIAVANNGLVLTTTGGLAFGNSTGCLSVPATTLVFSNSVTGATFLAPTPNLTPGGNFTVIAFTAADGTTQFAVLDNTFAFTSNNAGIRVFNAVSGQSSLNFQSNGTTIGGPVTFGTSSVFVSIASGTDDIAITSGGSLIIDTGSLNLSAGTTFTVVVGPALAGSTTLRSFTVNGC